jgi:MtN3 and saliva related transmembrane protein
VHDLSLLSYSMMCCGATLWLLYGLLKHDMPIILPNAINLVLLTLILVAKVRFR